MKAGIVKAERWPVALGVLLVAALGWAVWQAWRQPPRVRQPPRALEPVYNGMPISCWMIQPRTRDFYILGPSLYEPPSSLLRDSNAVPFLIRGLRRDSSLGATWYRKWVWANLPPLIQRRLPQPVENSTGTRTNAATLLGLMGPIAKPAIPALIQTLQQDDSPEVRQAAAAALGRPGYQDKIIAAALNQALQDTDARVRFSAAKALRSIDPEVATKAGVSPSPP
jgi:hypothetical protein